METPLEYVNQKAWEHKKQTGEIIVKICPFCKDEKYHFYIKDNKSGPYFCHKCNETGNLWTLKKHLGDIDHVIKPAFKQAKYIKPKKELSEEYHHVLLKDPEVLKYLTDRGINQKSIERFKLGCCTIKQIKCLSIPHFINSECLNIKARTLPPAEKSFSRITGCQSVLFNADALNKDEPVFICEGELDAITLIQHGFENIVSGTTGAGSFDAEWIDILKPVQKIYITYDSDQKGQEGARSLAKRLGYNRCYNLVLPDGMDVNDFFNSGADVSNFQSFLNEAHKFDLPGIISSDAAIDLLIQEQKKEESEDEPSGIQTPWGGVNRIVKGFKPGDLVVLSALAKTGKTTFALNISQKIAFEGTPVLFYCLEMRPERLVKKMLQAHYRREDLTEQDFASAYYKFVGLPLYLGYSFKKQNVNDLISLIREAVQRYDLQFVVFDNLHFLVRSIMNVNEEIGQAVQGLKLLAEEMEIPIMAIAQPRKRDSANFNEVMTAEDIKYSNSIHADCDQMIILHRKRIASKATEIDTKNFTAKTESLDPVTLCRVEAHRYGSGGETLLYFHGEYSRFDEMTGINQPDDHWSSCYM